MHLIYFHSLLSLGALVYGPSRDERRKRERPYLNRSLRFLVGWPSSHRNVTNALRTPLVTLFIPLLQIFAKDGIVSQVFLVILSLFSLQVLLPLTFPDSRRHAFPHPVTLATVFLSHPVSFFTFFLVSYVFCFFFTCLLFHLFAFSFYCLYEHECEYLSLPFRH